MKSQTLSASQRQTCGPAISFSFLEFAAVLSGMCEFLPGTIRPRERKTRQNEASRLDINHTIEIVSGWVWPDMLTRNVRFMAGLVPLRADGTLKGKYIQYADQP